MKRLLSWLLRNFTSDAGGGTNADPNPQKSAHDQIFYVKWPRHDFWEFLPATRESCMAQMPKFSRISSLLIALCKNHYQADFAKLWTATRERHKHQCWQKFSKVSSHSNFPCKITTDMTFETFYQRRGRGARYNKCSKMSSLLIALCKNQYQADIAIFWSVTRERRKVRMPPRYA